MVSAGTANDIGDRAAEWAVEVAHAEMTPDSRAALEAWLAADRRHRGAFARAQAWLRATEDAVVAELAPSASPRSALFRASNNDNGVGVHEVEVRSPDRGAARWSRRLIAGTAALAACVAGVIATRLSIPSWFGPVQVAATENVVNLKDGSVATLGRDARIEVALSDGIRRVTLLSGEATFHVHKDKARPFVVRSGDVYAQATGTVYSVARTGATGGAVKVTEGSVLVWMRDDRDQAVLLHAGGTLALNPGPRPPSPAAFAPPRLPPPELAQISLDNVPVRAAVARFNRVNSTKIVLDSSAIGDVRIIGLYHANDPDRFAEAVAAISGGKVQHERGRIVIKMKQKSLEN